jgi:hypothetical protein
MTDASLTRVRARVDVVFLWGLALFLVAGLVQIFLAGLGIFEFKGGKLADASSFDAHRMLGFAMGGVAVLLVIVAAVARASRRTITLSVVLALLSTLMQSVLAAVGENAAFFGGLHAVDGLLILGIAGYLHGAARRRHMDP